MRFFRPEKFMKESNPEYKLLETRKSNYLRKNASKVIIVEIFEQVEGDVMPKLHVDDSWGLIELLPYQEGQLC